MTIDVAPLRGLGAGASRDASPGRGDQEHHKEALARDSIAERLFNREVSRRKEIERKMEQEERQKEEAQSPISPTVMSQLRRMSITEK